MKKMMINMGMITSMDVTRGAEWIGGREYTTDVVEREKYDLLKSECDFLKHQLEDSWNRIDELDKLNGHMREKIDRSIVIPEGATNGDMIKSMFPNAEYREDILGNAFVISSAQLGYIAFRESWWNAPYKKESEE